jgi:hypothetical protein
MMKTKIAIGVCVSLFSLSPVHAAAVQFADFQTTALGITAIRDSFRVAIGGGTTAGANGSFGGVRREINWDGVPGRIVRSERYRRQLFQRELAARRSVHDPAPRNRISGKCQCRLGPAGSIR